MFVALGASILGCGKRGKDCRIINTCLVNEWAWSNHGTKFLHTNKLYILENRG